MENFDQIFTLLAEHEGHEGIGLNTDILETGLINILAVIVILVIFGQSYVGEILNERKEKIVNKLKNAQERLDEAQKRFDEAAKQLNQFYFVIKEIRYETSVTKEVLLEYYVSEAKKDLTIRFNRALANLKSKERQILLEIAQDIISTVMSITTIRVKTAFKGKEIATKLIDQSINKLKGDLL